MVFFFPYEYDLKNLKYIYFKKIEMKKSNNIKNIISFKSKI